MPSGQAGTGHTGHKRIGALLGQARREPVDWPPERLVDDRAAGRATVGLPGTGLFLDRAGSACGSAAWRHRRGADRRAAGVDGGPSPFTRQCTLSSSLLGRKHSPNISREGANDDDDNSYRCHEFEIGHLSSVRPSLSFIFRALQRPVNRH